MIDKPFILQGKDMSCQLIALLNAFVARYGKSPIPYPSREYRMLVEIGRGDSGSIISMKEVFLLFGVFPLEPPSNGGYDLEAWVRAQLNDGHPVSFPIRSPLGHGHQLLVVDVKYPRHFHHAGDRQYLCANPQYHNFVQVTDWLSWEQLSMAQSFQDSKGPYAIVWHNEWDQADQIYKRLAHPQTYKQAVRNFYNALRLTGFFITPKQKKRAFQPKRRKRT